MNVFEFDERKSQANLEKHGINFVSAQDLWQDPNIVEIQVRTEDEPCFLVIASIARKYWSAVITYRGSTIRIISVRRSRKAEVELYEN